MKGFLKHRESCSVSWFLSDLHQDSAVLNTDSERRSVRQFQCTNSRTLTPSNLMVKKSNGMNSTENTSTDLKTSSSE